MKIGYSVYKSYKCFPSRMHNSMTPNAYLLLTAMAHGIARTAIACCVTFILLFILFFFSLLSCKALLLVLELVVVDVVVQEPVLRVDLPL